MRELLIPNCINEVPPTQPQYLAPVACEHASLFLAHNRTVPSHPTITQSCPCVAIKCYSKAQETKPSSIASRQAHGLTSWYMCQLHPRKEQILTDTHAKPKPYTGESIRRYDHRMWHIVPHFAELCNPARLCVTAWPVVDSVTHFPPSCNPYTFNPKGCVSSWPCAPEPTGFALGCFVAWCAL